MTTLATAHMLAAPSPDQWFLEGYVGDERNPRRFMLKSGKTQVGRRESTDLRIPSSTVSGLHAELWMHAGRPWVRDAGSSNGTFVNRRRIDAPTALDEGDVIHFCKVEFVVGRIAPAPETEDEDRTCITRVGTAGLPARLATGTRELRAMIERAAVRPVFQPIVSLSSHPVWAFEILGRGAHPQLPSSPVELFRIAAGVNLEVDLSELFRRAGVYEARCIPGRPNLFFNTHPLELGQPGLLHSLETLRDMHPDLPLTLEIHEAAVTTGRSMKDFRAALTGLDIGLAYDDFGAGQARLVELAEVPPDYLKFDMSLVRDIHRAGKSKQRLVASLVRMVRELGSACVAEGVECAEELVACEQIGFQLAQGFHIGRPGPAQDWVITE